MKIGTVCTKINAEDILKVVSIAPQELKHIYGCTLVINPASYGKFSEVFKNHFAPTNYAEELEKGYCGMLCGNAVFASSEVDSDSIALVTWNMSKALIKKEAIAEKNTRCMTEIFTDNKNIRIKKSCSRGNHGSENNEYYFGNVLGAEHLGEFKPAGEFGFVKFQNGTVPENGVNGIYIEDLIEVCIDKLQMFQSTNLSCRHNALAITKLEEALHWLQARTADRRKRWVEGTCEK